MVLKYHLKRYLKNLLNHIYLRSFKGIHAIFSLLAKVVVEKHNLLKMPYFYFQTVFLPYLKQKNIMQIKQVQVIFKIIRMM